MVSHHAWKLLPGLRATMDFTVEDQVFGFGRPYPLVGIFDSDLRKYARGVKRIGLFLFFFFLLSSTLLCFCRTRMCRLRAYAPVARGVYLIYELARLLRLQQLAPLDMINSRNMAQEGKVEMNSAARRRRNKLKRLRLHHAFAIGCICSVSARGSHDERHQL